jgi:hypothetical protein
VKAGEGVARIAKSGGESLDEAVRLVSAGQEEAPEHAALLAQEA